MLDTRVPLLGLFAKIRMILKGGWNIADCVSRSYDVEGMPAGRIGLAVLKRMKPFDTHLHYFDRHRHYQ